MWHRFSERRLRSLCYFAVVAAAFGCTPDVPVADDVRQSHETFATNRASQAGHVVAQGFISDVRADVYRRSPQFIPCDFELSAEDRLVAFRMLEEYIQTQSWRPWISFVNVVKGRDDSVDCYFRGSEGGLLLLMVGNHHTVAEWRIDGYEIPERTFARPQGETYVAYINRSVAEHKKNAAQYEAGRAVDGVYYIQGDEEQQQ